MNIIIFGNLKCDIWELKKVYILLFRLTNKTTTEPWARQAARTRDLGA